MVILTQQECIKDDPEYAAAISRLETRECTLDDIDLFNSTVICSASHENSIDMHSPNKNNATSIVDTNTMCEILNAHKAESKCAEFDQPLVMCAAVNRCTSENLTDNEYHQAWTFLHQN